jgi:hypothetical protein
VQLGNKLLGKTKHLLRYKEKLHLASKTVLLEHLLIKSLFEIVNKPLTVTVLLNNQSFNSNLKEEALSTETRIQTASSRKKLTTTLLYM